MSFANERYFPKISMGIIDLETANEVFFRKGIKKAIDRKKVEKEDLFIITKLELEKIILKTL